MAKNTTTASKINAWVKRLTQPTYEGEHPLPRVLEEESGLDRYREKLMALPENHPGRINGLAAIESLMEALGRKKPEQAIFSSPESKEQ